MDLGTTVTDPRILSATNDGSSNFVIYALNENLEELELVVNEIGPITGRYPAGFLVGNEPRYLRVEAEGNWTLELSDITTARPWGGEAVAGVGNDVLLYTGDAGILDYSNSGDSNFFAYSYGASQELLINEIAPIQGSTTITAGPLVVTIDAQGEWSLTVRAI